MSKADIFEHEIDLITNPDLQAFVRYYLNEKTPDYFWYIGASSSGNYHPQFSQGEGGLVRHTKAVVMFAEELLRLNQFGYMREEYKDYVIAACIMHDTCKYGITDFDKAQYEKHAENAADLINSTWQECYGVAASDMLLSAVRCHMGQWSVPENRPFTSIDRCVHLADYVASRRFIDIPDIDSPKPKEENSLLDFVEE